MSENSNSLAYKSGMEGVKPLDATTMASAQKHMDSLIKPLGSLGRLEEISIQIAGITGKVHNNPAKKCIIVMAADNGICEEGVSSSPKEITLIQAINMTKGICGIGVLSKWAGSELKVVDIGIDGDYDNDQIIRAKVSRGTKNFAKEPAMSRDEVEQAIETGFKMVSDLAASGYQLIGTGEMGIGNTSTSSAVIMALTGASAEDAVGKGGGLTEAAYEKKKLLLERAILQHKPDPGDPIDVLSKVGGLDIAGLIGCFIGAACYRLPIVVDGVISIAAALAAERIQPGVRAFMIASHISSEPAYVIAERELQLKPMLAMNMRLGEGTGCPLAFQIIDAACRVMNEMATFEEVSVDKSYRIDNRR